MKRFLWIIFLCIAAILAGIIYYRYYYVFGEGVKAGELNFLVRKGYVFKTYEGKLIQAGFRSPTSGTIQSYEFEFSVASKDIAERLMRSSGKQVELHYKEYLHAIPWRGYNKYVVDSIISLKDLSR